MTTWFTFRFMGDIYDWFMDQLVTGVYFPNAEYVVLEKPTDPVQYCFNIMHIPNDLRLPKSASIDRARLASHWTAGPQVPRKRSTAPDRVDAKWQRDVNEKNADGWGLRDCIEVIDVIWLHGFVEDKFTWEKNKTDSEDRFPLFLKIAMLRG